MLQRLKHWKRSWALTFLLTTGLPFALVAQNNVLPYVRWICQYPSTEKQQGKKNISKRITETILGKKEVITLSRPVSVLAVNTDTILVLDQGLGTLIEGSTQALTIPHGLKKKFHDFNSLIGICKGPAEGILFTDSKLNHVYSIPRDKKEIQLVNDSLTLNQPTGIAYLPDKEQIWVAETAAHHVRVLDVKGNTVKIIGKRGTSPGEFNFPTSLWYDGKGTLYIVDAMNFRVQLFNTAGEYLSSFGEAGDASGYFARPKGIATDSSGNIYVVDALFHAVQVFSKNGAFLYSFGQQGQGREEFWMPGGIYIDSKNYIYVADTYNARIQVFKLITEE